MAIDICITTYRNVAKLKLCLQKIIEKTKYVDFKVYVLANDPNDEVKRAIDDSMYEGNILFTDRIEPIYNDTNSGSFASNNNELAKEGKGDYILFLNDDIEPINDAWLYSMQNILETDPKVGAVGALLLYPSGLIQHCGVFFSHKTNNLPFHIHYRQPVDKVREFISVPRYYQAVTGACLLIRRADFETLGGFNEEYFYGFEDVDLCLKLGRQLHKQCVYTPNAQLIHHEGISGSFKEHPKLQNNISVFRSKWQGQYMDDLDFYLSNPKHMIYRVKDE